LSFLNGMANLVGGILLLGLTCKICGNFFEGEKGSKCPDCGGASRKTRKSDKKRKSSAKTRVTREKSLLDIDFKIDL